MHIVTLVDSGIRTLADLRGKRVSVGAPGSGTEAMNRDMLAAVGMSFDQLAEAARLPFTATAAAIEHGRLDAGSLSVGLGSRALLDLASARHLALVCLSQAEQAAVTTAHSYYSRFAIPKDTYPGVDYACPTIQAANHLFVRADADPELVYRLTKVMFDNEAKLGKIQAAAAAGTEYALQSTIIPLYPGALRYYRERGIQVPERLLP
jgi:TRAP transporter TAXI family solute receptor